MKFFKRFNVLQFAAMLLLIAVGTVAIWSSGNARSLEVFHSMWINNLITAGLGLILYFLLAWFDYRRFLDYFSWPLYLSAIVMLVAVLVLGSTVYGGRRWLWFFQPSEISKFCIIALMAHVLVERRTWSFFAFLGLVGGPALLILAEPDLGTTLTLVPAVILMMFAAGVCRRGFLVLLAAAALGGAFILGAVYEAEKPGVTPERREQILKWVPLKDHQLKRVKVFLFPDADPQGSGYTLRQAKIAIGSGGFSGKGIGKGETNHLKYLPPSISMNDFIFCVYAEETGFVGSVILISLFGLVVFSGCWIAIRTKDERGRLLALGFSALVFAHVYINIAMSLGLLPITGLPLPFISSGRTFLISIMCGLGLIQSVSIHRDELY